MWILALAINLTLFTAATLLKRQYAQSHTVPASVSMAVSYTIGFMPIGLAAGLLLAHNVSWSWLTWWLLLGATLFLALFIWLSFLAMRYIPAALNQTLSQARIVIVIILGSLFLQESLTAAQFIGAALILAGGIVAIWAPAKAHRAGLGRHKHLMKGIILSVVSALFLGIGAILEKAVLRHMDIGAFFIYGFGLQTFWLIVFALKDTNGKIPAGLSKTIVRQSTIIGVLTAVFGISYFVALQGADNISLVQSLTALTLPMTAVAAHYFLKERDDAKLLWTAIIMSATGVVITAL